MSINDNAVGAPYVFRSHRPGDIGHIVARHGKIYDSEYGWDVRFEALVARLVADIISSFDPHRERFWIAENPRTGEFLGCIAVVQDPCDRKVALLRLLLVEEAARGMGLGARLIKECISFVRARGYSSITLKTYSVLEGARRLYARAGFRLVKTDAEKAEYGKVLMRETWELMIAGDSERQNDL